MNNNSKPLTKLQQSILGYIADSIRVKGYPPSLNEIAEKFQHSKATAQYYVNKLEERGYIRKGKYKTRALVINDNADHEIVQIPKLGLIAAGRPIEAIEDVETIHVTKSMVDAGSQYYALEVQGDSMIEDGVNDGDTILVRHQFVANAGDTVVAILDNTTATLKILKKDQKGFYLQPRNDRYKKIRQPFIIQGVMTGLIKNK